jgi:hypothetical protein
MLPPRAPYDRYGKGFNDCLDQINDLFDEIDLVEVVRCKDCKDYSVVIFNGERMHYGYCYNTHDSVLGNRHRYEGAFCSYGARKEDDGK